jgi:hypothetical protein
MNVAGSNGHALLLRDWLCASDEDLSPQAAVLSPAATIRIAEAIVRADSPYRQTIAAGLAAVCELRERTGAGRLKLSAKETRWLDRIESELGGLPRDEDELRRDIEAEYGDLFAPGSYGWE